MPSRKDIPNAFDCFVKQNVKRIPCSSISAWVLWMPYPGLSKAIVSQRRLGGNAGTGTAGLAAGVFDPHCSNCFDIIDITTRTKKKTKEQAIESSQETVVYAMAFCQHVQVGNAGRRNRGESVPCRLGRYVVLRCAVGIYIYIYTCAHIQKKRRYVPSAGHVGERNFTRPHSTRRTHVRRS